MEKRAPLEYLCFVTNAGYATGAVCLAQSLALVGSRATLRAIATSADAAAALREEVAACAAPPPVAVELRELALPEPLAAHGGSTHSGKGAVLSVDAPRRCLWGDGKAFMLLDADLLAVTNPDPHLEPLLELAQGGAEPPAVFAVANFRLKKKAFCEAGLGGNFNAGVMVVPRPDARDGAALEELVRGAGPDDTEEVLLNRLFAGRWAPLPHGLNVPKRVLHHAPMLWNNLLDSQELVFAHLMGAKPWMSDPKARAAADWEAERPAYAALEATWWAVRRGEVVSSERDGALNILAALPSGSE